MRVETKARNPGLCPPRFNLLVFDSFDLVDLLYVHSRFTLVLSAPLSGQSVNIRVFAVVVRVSANGFRCDQRGMLVMATYDIGCIIGTILSIVGDKLGRRRSILIGCHILLLGAVLQTASWSVAQMIVGGVVAGFGNGMNTIAIPIWQAEATRPQDRGKLMVAQVVTVIFGIVITNWINYGFTFFPNYPVSWRFLAFQCFFALVTVAMVLISFDHRGG